MIFFAKSSGIKPFLRNAQLAPKVEAYLLRLLAAFLLRFGRMTASQAGHAVPTHARHRANVARFLAASGWSADWTKCLRLAVLVLEEERRKPGTWIFLLDQTHCSQQGQKTENTYSTGNRLRRPQKRRRHGKKRHAPRTVHAFVFGLLITPGGLRLPTRKCYFTKAYCAQKNLPYKTEADLGAELVAELEVPAGARVVVLGDTAYEAKAIRAACAQRNWSWIVPLNPERVLAGAKPRPKVRSLIDGLTADRFVPVRLHPTKGEHVAQRRLSPCRIGPKTKGRTYYVHTETREVHSVGRVQLAFSCKEAPRKNEPIRPKILMTSDLGLEAKEIVELYGLRWQIELFFKEMKSTLGMHHYRFRQYEKVAAWTEAALVAFLYAEWIRARRLRSRRLGAEQKRWWRSQRTYGILRAVRQQAEAKELEELGRLANSKSGQKSLRKLLRAAQPPEYRPAC